MSSDEPSTHRQDPERLRFTMCDLRVKIVRCGVLDFNCIFCAEAYANRYGMKALKEGRHGIPNEG